LLVQPQGLLAAGGVFGTTAPMAAETPWPVTSAMQKSQFWSGRRKTSK
jgi:hypothetical protein